ncbi:MAG: GTP 3',8-cyclase MoaA [Eggerthellaceae bacterium]|jgi:cyclic pyranopterin phosphate synthase
MSIDRFGRTTDYLRISVTERCNFRCVYCMPPEGIKLKPHDQMMTFEEIERLVHVATALGFSHIRLTGGEPLVRLGIDNLVESLAHMDGVDAVAMTTNGSLLAPQAASLASKGLSRVNISIDSLDPEQFKQITRRDSLEDTLAGIDAALEAGLNPVKINCVVVRQLHQDILRFAQMSIDRPLHVRFIEYMPVGHPAGIEEHGWTADDSVPSAELLETINRLAASQGLPALEPVAPDDGHAPLTWGPARTYRFPGAQGTVGFISALSQHFCGNCNRLRVTADGKIRPCLFSDREYDVLTALRGGTDDDVRAAFETALANKPDAHHWRVGTYRSMAQIGG